MTQEDMAQPTREELVELVHAGHAQMETSARENIIEQLCCFIKRKIWNPDKSFDRANGQRKGWMSFAFRIFVP